jgi:LCP family protein required for cell wall assembly
VVLLAGGGAFYLWFRGEVGASNARVDPEIIEALGEKPGDTASEGTTGSDLPKGTTTTEVAPEAPSGMNIILLGSDTRSSDGKGGRSDTIILVHVDADKEFLSLLSIPRDLKVTVPGHGTRKINAAYAYGGAALLIRTIQSSLGVDLDHYMKVDFAAFKEITDTLGGVYIDVDRTYDDGKIRLSPGYQLLDGQNALRFVRTRHDTNIDFGRMERQQRFLMACREQALGWNLAFKLPSLVDSVFENVDTDLSADEIASLAYWGVKLDGSRMKQATIIARTGTIDGVSYVLASEKQLESAVKDFLSAPTGLEEPHEEDVPANAVLRTVDLDGITVDVVNATGRTGQAAFAAVWLSGLGATVGSLTEGEETVSLAAEVTHPATLSEAAGLVAQSLGIVATRESSAVTGVTVVLGPSFSLGAWQVASKETAGVPGRDAWTTLAGKAGFPLVAPGYVPERYAYSYQRSYTTGTAADSLPAVRVGYKFGKKDQYLGVSATRWLDAPIASPGREVKGDGVVYTAVGTRTKTAHVWWAKDGVLYWVSNTLLYELSKEHLLAVAVSAVAVSASSP